MHALVDWLTGLSGPVVYLVVVGLVFAEDALFFGFVLPGETAVIIGGVLARRGTVDPVWLTLAVVVAAVAGDSVGYEMGRRLGPPLLDSRPLRRRADRVGKASALLRRRGPAAVFVGRFVALFRSLVPALAGAARMPYRRFLLYNALGALVWGVGNALVGYAAGAAYERVEGVVGRTVALVSAVLVVAALVVWWVRRHRRSRT
ncbi:MULTISPECIES: DedA family protein [Streptomyces]|jgi:membrane protein DedA with SNARE-associated domain|uniref:DedA family protein n=1 Tax=Streptomyces spinosisporus TaxID=2927582 RepID=A0ABS9XV64_9ACTN|nr:MULTISPECIES: DedA family protein [Streptomyces]MCI3245945.1 DedA family protein [Streptomyces spinosisporus]WUB34374.1 DedA family protein [Streptomyces sp. NBC_00588]